MNKTGKYVFLIFFVSLVVFSNGFNNDFVFDDHSIVDQNVLIRSLKNIPRFFVSSYWPISQGGEKKGIYRPVIITSYALDYFVWKLNSFGYHLTNYLFHSLNGILIFFLCAFILRRFRVQNNTRVALLAALVFIAHPVHVEAVTGIVGRAELVSTFFFLAALFLYIRSKKSLRYYFISLFSFMLALMSKESAATLPAIIVLWDLLLNKKNGASISFKKIKSNISRYLGYLAVTAVYLVIRLSVLSGIGPVGGSKVFHLKSISARVYTMSVVFMNYVKLLFYPVGLSPEKRDFPIFENLLEPGVIPGILVVILVVFIAFYMLKRRKLIAFCVFWFLIALLPVSNIIPIGILIADRLLYLPSVGFSILMAMPLLAVKKRKSNLMTFMLIAVIVSYSLVTMKRNTDWKNDLILWERTVQRFPDNYVAHNNIGALYYIRGMYDKAIKEYEKVIEIQPDYVEAWNNMGFAYKKKGLWKKAIGMYNKAIEINPEHAPAYNGLGYLYYEKNDYDKAEEWYKKAIGVDPELEEAYNNLGLIYQNKKMYAEAAECYKRAVEINPEYENGHYNFANLYYGMGKYSDSVREFIEVSKVNPDRADIYMNIGMVYYSKLMQYGKASDYFHKYLEISPNAPDRETIKEIIKQIGG